MFVTICSPAGSKSLKGTKKVSSENLVIFKIYG